MILRILNYRSDRIKIFHKKVLEKGLTFSGKLAFWLAPIVLVLSYIWNASCDVTAIRFKTEKRLIVKL